MPVRMGVPYHPGSRPMPGCPDFGFSVRPALDTSRAAPTGSALNAVFVRSGSLGGIQNGKNWTDAYLTLQAALATSPAVANPIFVADDHNESTTGALTLTAGASGPGTPYRIYCAYHTEANPRPTDVLTTGTGNIVATGALQTNGNHIFYGLHLKGTSIISPIAGSTIVKYKDCLLEATTGTITLAQSGGYAELVNTPVKFGTSGGIVLGAAVKWKDTASAIQGTAPATLFSYQGVLGGLLLCEGIDFSGMGSGQLIQNGGAPSGFSIVLDDCQLGASTVISNTASPPSFQGAAFYDAIRCAASGINYANFRYRYQGYQTVETTIVRTGGGTDGSTPVSWKIITNGNTFWDLPFDAIPIAFWNDNTNVATSVTMYGVWNAAALPNNDDIWVDVECLASSSSSIGSRTTGSKTNSLATGTALTASTQAWDSLVAARQNSHATTVGDVIAVADNPGRIFFCTATTGDTTTAGSEPAGYASAVDGGIVVDNNATFRAGVRFQLTVTVTPQIVGVMNCYVRAAKTSSTFYVDPQITQV